MKIWELHHSLGRNAEGEPNDYFVAELSEQPLVCYAAGAVLYKIWQLIGPRMERWIPFGRDSRFYKDGTFSLGWQHEYEIWAAYDALRWRRRIIEEVRVADRDPNAWFRPGGDAPISKDAS